MERISAVYKIVNIVTGDCYVGSSRNVWRRKRRHFALSSWRQQKNSLMYKDMQKYGTDKFKFQILCPVEPEHLKEVEQELIDLIKPTYNSVRAYGIDLDKRRKHAVLRHKRYLASPKGKAYVYKRERSSKMKEYRKSYRHRICIFNNEELTLNALYQRLKRAGVEKPFNEARKYLKGE